MRGTVITFYSFKGGVGRSFALANIAVLLARWGNRVLCVDWDLEAPGLHHYFRPLMNGEPTSGVVDLVDDFRAGRFRPGHHVVKLAGFAGLDFIAAGGQEIDDAGRVQDIDWDGLYDQGFGDYLERCRAEWVENYEFVLLDSRTGVSDIGGICTAQLPDRLVVLFTANAQSVRGAVDVAHRAKPARDRLPLDRPRLSVVPVLSRFDTRDEYTVADRWRDTCFEEAKDLFGSWLDTTVQVSEMARHLTIPYVSFWAYGEQLAVEHEKDPAADQISFALETIAAVIAHDLDRTALLAENRDAFVAVVRDRKRDYAYDIRVSAPRTIPDTGKALAGELAERGLLVERSLSGDREQLTRVSDESRHLCLVIDRELTRWQFTEAEIFLHRTVGQERRVIPVLTADTKIGSLPGFIANLRYLRLGAVPSVAGALADQVTGVLPLVDTEIDLVDLLSRVARATLRPQVWELVNEFTGALIAGVGDGDGDQVRSVAADLEFLIRPRAAGSRHVRRTALPDDVREVVDEARRVVGARATDTREEAWPNGWGTSRPR
ncbi:CATRA system-associated protein [Actinokineospora inagensis]|uniref:CATRA system-associated protein n=1 Tax=Actinokineospora inagensis TaxID=103730 RepID=UPI00041FCCBE|nr:CATRA system-associated protein [Actinokineospora inagensis]